MCGNNQAINRLRGVRAAVFYLRNKFVVKILYHTIVVDIVANSCGAMHAFHSKILRFELINVSHLFKVDALPVAIF